MAEQWHYSSNGEQHGPVSAARLKELATSGELAPTDLVWKEGMADWKPAKSIKGLFPSQAPASPAPPPPLPSPTAAPDAGTTLWQRIYADRLIFLGCCLAVSLLLTWIVPGFFTPSKSPSRGSDGYFGAADREENLDRTLEQWRRESMQSRRSTAIWTLFLLIDAALIAAIARIAYRRYAAGSLDRLYESSPPPLPFAHPWNTDERHTPNRLQVICRFGAIGVGGLFVLSLLHTAFDPSSPSPGIVLSLLLALPLGGIFIVGVATASLIHAKWLPADGDAEWIAFHRGGSVSRENGTATSFRLLKNRKFIDFWENGVLTDSWKVLTLDQKSLEVQDREGRTRRYKKSMTAAEKIMSNPLALLDTSREELLAETWLPADGTGRWIQFSRDGAFVSGDNTAGRYTLSGEQPNETIRVQLTDNSTRQFKVVSLSLNQLVLDEGGKATIYHRQRSSKKAGNAAQADSSGSQAAPPDDGGSSENPLAGIFNFFTKYKCRNCHRRAAKRVGRQLLDRRQQVQTKFDHLGDGRPKQMWVNVSLWKESFRCDSCGHAWYEENTTSERA